MSEGASALGKGRLESAKQVLDELRRRFFGACDRLERAGLNAGMVVTIGELYRAVEHERLRKSLESSTGQPIGLAFAEALSVLDLGGVPPGTGGEGSSRARDAIVSGGSDPSSPAPTESSSHSALSHAATRARIEEGLIGI